MAQWQELLRLDSVLQDRVRQLYEGQLPREIRHWLADWIENQDWGSAAVDENKASSCFHALLGHLEELWNRSVQENNILQGPDFLGMKHYLVEHFQDKPVNLAILVSECLKEEKKILTSANPAEFCSNPGMQQKRRKLDNNVAELKMEILEVKKEIKTLESLNEKLDFIQMTWQNRVENNIGLARSQAVVEEECLKQANLITQTKQIVLQQIVNISNKAAQMVATLTDVELPEWKRQQQLACIGSPEDLSLDHLQKWFTTAAEVLLGVREQLLKLQEQNNKYSSADSSSPTASIAEIEKFALSLITKLLTNALVVEKQPVMHNFPYRPLILKTRGRFTMTVRFLANLSDFKFLLKVKPVFDKDVEEASTVKGFRLFDFTKVDSKVLDEDVAGGGLIAEFGHMSLKETSPRNKGSCESRLGVTEELHTISFVTLLQHAGQRFNIETTSLPVVVISSTNQVPSAWASIMWWNLVSSGTPMNLLLFANPPLLTWQQLAPVLSWQFLSVGQRELDEDQLSMLRDKLVDDADGLVHWCMFKDEGAWIWIDAILDLIRKHLADLWRDGSIMGFVSRQRTKFLLQSKPAGTFLIRFSESNKDGAITFSWVDHSRGEASVHAVQPYTKKELLTLSLPDAINNYTLTANGKSSNPLLYLYPDIPKDTAFKQYYKVPVSTATNYIRKTIVVISVDPTPPSSPPRETSMMDVDAVLDINADLCRMMEEFDCDSFLAESDVMWPECPNAFSDPSITGGQLC
ncbi:signal transducer and activator of transcription 1-like [Melanotaenia boesemani]|uniref:signal transducer and activator of transcription 1-like n=1 Tax=Melanotaenia boesemani TaxID=1250792 RepID=UPI001C0520F2|nr:signal transducer and activator of transcription 1-like [Melanotaenia boesemani]